MWKNLAEIALCTKEEPCEMGYGGYSPWFPPVENNQNWVIPPGFWSGGSTSLRSVRSLEEKSQLALDNPVLPVLSANVSMSHPFHRRLCLLCAQAIKVKHPYTKTDKSKSKTRSFPSSNEPPCEIWEREEVDLRLSNCRRFIMMICS